MTTSPEVVAPAGLGLTAAERERARRWWVLAVMCLSLVIISLSNTSLNVALPTLARELQTSPGALQWIVDAYSLVFAGCLLIAGAAGDRFGRRAALNVGLTIFGVASALAAFSDSAPQLIVARGVMGLGAALIMPATLAIIAQVFPPDERARAVAIWAGFAGAGGAAGSLMSGWLLQHFWLGSIFISNVVVVVVALVAGALVVPSSRDDSAPRLDPLGAVLSMLGLALLLFTIIEAPAHGWRSWETAAGFAVSLVVLAGFVAWERSAREPMLDLRLFRDRSFSGASLTITLIFFVMYGTVFVLTQYLQLVRDYTPLETGLRLLPLPVSFLLAAPQSARLVSRWGHRRVVCSGLCLLGAGTALLALAAVLGTYPVVAVGLVMAAVGMGMTTAPSTGAIMFSVPLEKAGVASAVNDTTRELGGALGVAVLGSVLISSFHASLGGSGQADVAGSSLVAGGHGGTVDVASHAAAQDSFAHGAQVAFLTASGMAVVAAFAVGRVLRSASSNAWEGTPPEAGEQAPLHAGEPTVGCGAGGPSGVINR